MRFITLALAGVILASCAGRIPMMTKQKKDSTKLKAERVEKLTRSDLDTEHILPAGLVRYKLPNGLTVVLMPSRSAPVVAIDMWVQVGSASETDSEAGLAHVFEHMLFKGTDRRAVGQIAIDVERNGGDINAYTTFDHTVYYITIASRHYKEALDIMSDAIQNSSFDPEELEKELKVVQEEIKRGLDSPESNLYRNLFKKAFQVHPYKRPIIGYKKTVDSFTRPDIIKFYKRWYVPSNMALIVAGDFETDEVRSEIERLFGGFKSSKKPRKLTYEEPPQKQMRTIVLEDDIKRAYFYLAFHLPEILNDDIPALDVLSYILGAGESSRLYRSVQWEKQLVQGIFTYAFTPKDPGLFIIGASLDPQNLEAALEATLDETFLTIANEVTQTELRKARLNIESESIYAKETAEGLARKLGFYEVVAGDLSFEERYLSKIAAVSQTDILNVMKKYIKPTNMTVAILVPNGEAKNISSKRIKTIATKSYVKANRKRDEQPEVPEVKKVVLPNGVTLLVRQMRSVPIVVIRSVSLGGIRFESPGNVGINNFISRLFTKGTSKRSALEIATEIDTMAASLSGYSGRDSIGMSGEFLSRDFDRGLELFADALLNSAFPQSEVKKQRAEILAALKEQMDSPQQITALMFRKTLFKTHPYGFNRLGNKSSIKGITRQDLINYYSAVIRPENLVISVVGDVPVDTAINKLTAYFEPLKMKGFAKPKVPREPDQRRIRRVETSRKKAQAQIILGFKAASHKSKDKYALEVLNYVLAGQGGRLFLELRDRQALAYAVSSFSVEAMDPGYFAVYIGTSPDKVDVAVSGILEELKKIQTGAISKKELERAIGYLIGNHDIELQKYSSWAAILAHNEAYGMGWMEYMRYPEKIREVTISDVKKAAKKYLDLDAYTIAILRPK